MSNIEVLCIVASGGTVGGIIAWLSWSHRIHARDIVEPTIVEKHYGGILVSDLRQWLNSQDINGDTIGSIRRQCFVPWDSPWNSLVRDETAARERLR